MKRLLVLLATAGIVSVTHAQLSKGQWIVGGNAGFSYSDTHEEFKYVTASNKSSSLQLSPVAGYFVLDKFCIGLRPRAEWLRIKTNGVEYINGDEAVYTSDSKSTTLGIGPFVRYYFLPKGNKINLVADAGYAYSHAKIVSNATGLNFNAYLLPDDNILLPLIGTKYNLHVFSLSAGPVIFLNSKTAVEFLVGYSYSYAGEIGVSESALSVSAGFQIHLGK